MKETKRSRRRNQGERKRKETRRIEKDRKKEERRGKRRKLCNERVNKIFFWPTDVKGHDYQLKK
jgi:hypothetical protein